MIISKQSNEVRIPDYPAIRKRQIIMRTYRKLRQQGKVAVYHDLEK
jgi:hypothetical protein